jgi:hypothetical protein
VQRPCGLVCASVIPHRASPNITVKMLFIPEILATTLRVANYQQSSLLWLLQSRYTVPRILLNYRGRFDDVHMPWTGWRPPRSRRFDLLVRT